MTQAAPALDTTWLVDAARSTVGFTIGHLKIATVKGRFRTFAGMLGADEHGALHAAGTVDAATLDTGNALRDRRLRGREFFDTARHPEIRFASRHVERLGDGRLRIAGDLTIGGATRRVELHSARRGATEDRLELTVTGTLSRAAFGFDSADLKAAGIPDSVALVATLSLTRAGRARARGRRPPRGS